MARPASLVRRSGGPVAGRRRRSAWGRAAVALVLLGLALLVDAAWVGTTLLREAGHIRRDLGEGSTLLEMGRVEEAGTRFALAGRAAGSLAGALRHPAAILAGLVPGLGDDVDAARALADASSEVATAGTALVRAAARAGWAGRSVPGLAGPGRVDVAAIAGAAPALREAADAVGRARALLRGVDLDGLAGSLAAAVERARTELEARGPTLERAADAAELLPSFLGAGGPRRYLLVAQNLSDPRGSGGHVGSHAVLTVDHGRFELGPMVATVELGRGPAVDAPPDVARRYRRFGSLEWLMAATYPPDFRTAGRLLVDLWAARGEEPVDGVVSVDAVWMAYLLEAIGPVETPDWPEPITAGNAVDVLARGTFETGDSEVSNALQAALAEALWRAALERTPELHAFADALGRAGAERHLQVYSVHPEEEALLEELGVAGAVPQTDHPLQVVWDGASDNRAGYFAEKEVAYRAVLSPDGWAEVDLAATLRNGAPSSGPPSILLGTPGPRFGWFWAYVNVHLPPGARVLDLRGGSLAFEEREGGRPVAMGLVGAGPGGSQTFRVRYRTEAAEELPDGSRRFALDVLPQPALRPDLVRVEVALPAGAEVLGASPGVRVEAGMVTWEGTPTTPERLWVRYR